MNALSLIDFKDHRIVCFLLLLKHQSCGLSAWRRSLLNEAVDHTFSLQKCRQNIKQSKSLATFNNEIASSKNIFKIMIFKNKALLFRFCCIWDSWQRKLDTTGEDGPSMAVPWGNWCNGAIWWRAYICLGTTWSFLPSSQPLKGTVPLRGWTGKGWNDS